MRISIPSLGKIWLFGFLNIIFAGSMVSPTHANLIDGVGELKFGMKPNEVESLEGCSSETQCLYEILGKNRYFTLVYGAKETSTAMVPPPPTATLTHIHIDMGVHTDEWFDELYATLDAQHHLSYLPTNQEKARFNKGTDNELTIGFANGSVLLKFIRRQFGNLVLRVVIQDQKSATALRQIWEHNSTQPASQ